MANSKKDQLNFVRVSAMAALVALFYIEASTMSDVPDLAYGALSGTILGLSGEKIFAIIFGRK